MKLDLRLVANAVLVAVLVTPPAWAQPKPTPEMLKAKEFFETAGYPGKRWIEAETMVPHVAPASHFKATMLYYPGTGELQSDEVRVVFMGIGPAAGPRRDERSG